MIRIGLILTLLVALAVMALALLNDPGQATVVWLHHELSMTAVTAALLVLLGALAYTLFWRLVLWIAEGPKRSRAAKAEARRRQAAESLSKGFLAAAAGDGAAARRHAQKAADLVDDSPALVRVLAAQAAEAAGDLTAAAVAYTAMLGFPEMRLAGLRGLMQTALAQNDRLTALRYAQEAYSLAKTARWAWRALLEDRLEAGDWASALDLVKGALERKIVSPIVAERARAALLAASAANLENRDERSRAQALEFAVQSAKLKPDFAPGVTIAARMLAAEGKQQKASGLIETAWKAEPHPALWLTYRDLRTNETPRERARRLELLALSNPQPRESRILMVEQALISGGPSAMREAVLGLSAEEPTARMCGLRARVAYGMGDADEARAWVARAADAPTEPEWSDIALDGSAFAYAPGDWSRLVSTYAETGELIHPRDERRERTISELPDLPLAYPSANPYLRAAESGASMIPIPDDPGPYAGPYDDGDGDSVLAPVPGERRRAPRRRLPTAPRAAK
ncbi:heme biosynthesis HemY N-terminal domain-containing protein [soil metagenome]